MLAQLLVEPHQGILFLDQTGRFCENAALIEISEVLVPISDCFIGANDLLIFLNEVLALPLR